MKNIIFDLGNVLMVFDPFTYLSSRYDKQTVEDLMMTIFCSLEWDELDLGIHTIDEVINTLTKQAPAYSKELTYVLKHSSEMMVPINENIALLKKLKAKGYRLYLLSNFQKDAFLALKNKYEFFKLLDGGVVSAFEHVVKPSPAIFKILLERYHLNPDECLFIDDSSINIESARKLGMECIFLDYGTNLSEELKKRNV